MKLLLPLVGFVALLGAVTAGPISMNNNNIGDIVKVDVEAEIDIESKINVELVNVIAELLLELRDVNINVCRQSSESDSSSSSSSSSEETSEESSEESLEVTSTTITTTGPSVSTTPEIGPGTQTTTRPLPTTVPTTVLSTSPLPDALPYQQLVHSLVKTRPEGYDAPGITKEQKEKLWRQHVEQLVQKHIAGRQ
uniref:Uncharacterized protein n=1 Tax=Anopheles epiroticus TaxID=199890 RepID=A0A182P858_9DIPT